MSGREARPERPIVRAAEDVAKQEVSAGEGTHFQVLLGPEDGAPNFALRRFVMQASGGMPRHTNSVEHEQYVLAGSARVTIGDEVFRVGQGDVVYIPAGAPHSYDVLEAPFEFLCIVPNAPDRIDLLEGA